MRGGAQALGIVPPRHSNMTTVLLLLTGLVAVAWCIPHPVTLEREWEEYKKSFGKFYTSEDEDARRLDAYLETKREVEEHNRKYERGETGYTMEMNKFADWFPEELDKLNGLKFNNRVTNGEVFELSPGVEVPDEINWVEKGAVTRVKDQGQCGSCYAFSAVGALEGLMYTTNKTITDLSVQEILDCSEAFGNTGCYGGRMTGSFDYVKEKNKISTDKSYPYIADDDFCKADSGKFGATCTGYVQLEPDEGVLKKAVGTVGPVSMAFAVSRDFVKYHGGIFDGSCDHTLNHGMLVVGYGRHKKTGKDYWLVKNSWGEKWGLKGYVKIIRGRNECNISAGNSYPVYKAKCEVDL